MSNESIEMDDELDNVIIISSETKSTEEYLDGLADEMLDLKKKENDLETKFKKSQAEIREQKKNILIKFKKISTDGKKTKIVKKVKNITINNKLAEAFPKDFKAMQQKVDTNTKNFPCERAIIVTNEKTGKIEKTVCKKEFSSEKGLKIHIAKHKKKGELV